MLLTISEIKLKRSVRNSNITIVITIIILVSDSGIYCPKLLSDPKDRTKNLRSFGSEVSLGQYILKTSIILNRYIYIYILVVFYVLYMLTSDKQLVSQTL